jgi:hypothetical protein
MLNSNNTSISSSGHLKDRDSQFTSDDIFKVNLLFHEYDGLRLAVWN